MFIAMRARSSRKMHFIILCAFFICIGFITSFIVVNVATCTYAGCSGPLLYAMDFRTCYEANLPANYMRFMSLLLQRWDALCRRHNITYVLMYGTALGAYRHEGRIPWDDDLDVMIAHRDRWKMYQAVRRHSGRSLRVNHCNLSPRFWKVYLGDHNLGNTERSGLNSRLSVDTEAMWPYLDVFFYEHIDGGQRINVTDPWYDYQVFPVRSMFPAQTMLFDGGYYPAPRDLDTYFNVVKYNVTECVSKWHFSPNYIKERLCYGYTVLCKDLKDVVYFSTAFQQQVLNK